mmetsp:Transcript_27695/g.61144  ORF Transcript_27695/g.61144 Transcript_27695/m.61144 type:complete len:211 (-) Transcript_27695:484-1116(-)
MHGRLGALGSQACGQHLYGRKISHVHQGVRLNRHFAALGPCEELIVRGVQQKSQDLIPHHGARIHTFPAQFCPAVERHVALSAQALLQAAAGQIRQGITGKHIQIGPVGLLYPSSWLLLWRGRLLIQEKCHRPGFEQIDFRLPGVAVLDKPLPPCDSAQLQHAGEPTELHRLGPSEVTSLSQEFQAFIGLLLVERLEDSVVVLHSQSNDS